MDSNTLRHIGDTFIESHQQPFVPSRASSACVLRRVTYAIDIYEWEGDVYNSQLNTAAIYMHLTNYQLQEGGSDTLLMGPSIIITLTYLTLLRSSPKVHDTPIAFRKLNYYPHSRTEKT